MPKYYYINSPGLRPLFALKQIQILNKTERVKNARTLSSSVNLDQFFQSADHIIQNTNIKASPEQLQHISQPNHFNFNFNTR